MDTRRLIYLHGLESDSTSGMARQYREWLPGMLTPDFKGLFEERMDQLEHILAGKDNWILIGSSFGDLIGTVNTQKSCPDTEVDPARACPPARTVWLPSGPRTCLCSNGHYPRDTG